MHSPTHPVFNDRYFSDDDGLSEALHVFIAGNNLSARISTAAGSLLPHSAAEGYAQVPVPPPPVSAVFRIAETGFGTGLNLLALMHDLRAIPAPVAAVEAHSGNAPTPAVLRLVWHTVEAYPLEPAVSAEWLSVFPMLAPYSAAVTAALETAWEPAARHPEYPGYLLVPEGWYRVPLGRWRLSTAEVSEVDFILEIRVGDVREYLAELRGITGGAYVDAWVLDGHSPSINQEMWTKNVCTGIAAVSAPGRTSFATFTAAGTVKSGLRNAGFEVRRSAGYGKKRHMINGIYRGIS